MASTTTEKELMTVQQAARALGVSDARVQQMLKASELRGELHGNRRFVFAADVRARRRKTALPAAARAALAKAGVP